MRAIAIVLFVLLGFGSTTGAARAEQSNSCAKCREQRQACAKNYTGPMCKTEYDICMKHCQRK